jgi:hypothetical protein
MQPRPEAELAGVRQKDQKLAESAWRLHVEYAHIEHIFGTKISGGAAGIVAVILNSSKSKYNTGPV